MRPSVITSYISLSRIHPRDIYPSSFGLEMSEYGPAPPNEAMLGVLSSSVPAAAAAQDDKLGNKPDVDAPGDADLCG